MNNLNNIKDSWFVFDILTGEINLEDLLKYGKLRIDVLFDFAVNKKILDVNQVYASTIGTLALMITAAYSGDAFFRNWLLETEADLFDYMFRNERQVEVKWRILRWIYRKLLLGINVISDELGIPLDELERDILSVSEMFISRRDKQAINVLLSGESIVAIPFTSGYKLVRGNKGIVRRGWIITVKWELARFAKSTYQRLLFEKIQDIQRRSEELDESMRDTYLYFAKELLDYWKSKRLERATKFVATAFKGNLWEKLEFFPPCSWSLYNQFKSTGYIPHGERLQLGLFLKALGMPVEEQLKFWYSAVDNVGMSWDEFLKKGGYYIRHIYGLEGSRKDYSAPRCDTIMAKYYCPFARLSFSELRKLLLSMDGALDNRFFGELRELVARGDFKKACAHFLKRYAFDRFKLKLKVFEVRHPVSYVRLLQRLVEKKKRGSKVGGGMSAGG